MIDLNKPYIETEIDEQGNAKIEAKNYVGPTCKADTTAMAQALYGPTFQGQETIKPEYHKSVVKPQQQQHLRQGS